LRRLPRIMRRLDLLTVRLFRVLITHFIICMTGAKILNMHYSIDMAAEALKSVLSGLVLKSSTQIWAILLMVQV